MADTTGFSHITVSTDDDDDVVIQAGIAEGAFEEPAEEAGERAVEADDPAEEELPESECEATPAAAELGAGETRRAAADDDGYRETTLDDIEGAKMSTTQKAVIVVALLGIIAFAAWYLFAR